MNQNSREDSTSMCLQRGKNSNNSAYVIEKLDSEFVFGQTISEDMHKDKAVFSREGRGSSFKKP